MNSILIDTTVFISVLRKHLPSQNFLNAHLDYVMSYVTYGELLQGSFNKQEKKKVVQIANNSKIHWGSESIHKKACEIVLQYGPSHGVGFFDALITATAMEEGLTLVTDNVKHFQMIKGLKVRKPGKYG